MPGRFKAGDRLQHDFLDALQAQLVAKSFSSPWGPSPALPVSPRPTGVIVIAEENPGQYRCLTPFGVTMLIDEGKLFHMGGQGNSQVAADHASIADMAN